MNGNNHNGNLITSKIGPVVELLAEAEGARDRADQEVIRLEREAQFKCTPVENNQFELAFCFNTDGSLRIFCGERMTISPENVARFHEAFDLHAPLVEQAK